jgi:hypothetical protein
MENIHELPDGDYIANGHFVTKKNGVFRDADGTGWVGDILEEEITEIRPARPVQSILSSDPVLHEAYKGAIAMLDATPENPTMTDIETILKRFTGE